jgi:hypothetical protein
MLSFAKNLLSVSKILLPFHASAWKATSEPIRRMLEEDDEEKKDKLTTNWRESTQTQLSTISVTVRTLLHKKRDFIICLMPRVPERSPWWCYSRIIHLARSCSIGALNAINYTCNMV